MIKILDLYDLSRTLAGEWMKQFTYPWETLGGIGELVLALGAQLDPEVYDQPREGVWIARDAVVAPSAHIDGPAIIGPGTEVRHCAFIRGSALVGEGCVVGNSTELKNVILFDGVQVPHYNYVGDSILGHKAHMGAGAITSNVKSDKTLVVVKDQAGDLYPTGRKKVGALLGDEVEIGCNAVLNPGTIVGRCSAVYPTSCARGVIPADSILKATGEVVPKR
ncbi:MAG: UDP-N-acetylglucosamine pyrophosphorylase [Clostridiales bacterium]|nr:UDP-N-acetylglucosamine pyrophosphorylase [Clostridiales bacterium]